MRNICLNVCIVVSSFGDFGWCSAASKTCLLVRTYIHAWYMHNLQKPVHMIFANKPLCSAAKYHQKADQ